ncbi:hypothetical protein DL765_008030 [Monosporascus sp. GIB2]|nr:hypothetical protein DL765_008030 [Monosporascus sp. GIB2]
MHTTGESVRVAPNEIVFSMSQAALDIYNAIATGHDNWVKTDLMDFGTGNGGFIWEEEPVKCREVAKKILPAFNPMAIRVKQAIVPKYIDLFVRKMKEVGGNAEGVEIAKIWKGASCITSLDGGFLT